MNCKAGSQFQLQWSFYNTLMHVMSFGSPFEMFSCFVLGKCTMSCEASKPIEGNEGLGLSGWVNGNYNS